MLLFLPEIGVAGYFFFSYNTYQACSKVGGSRPPDFGGSVNPISTRWDTLSPPSTTCPPGFLTLAACLHLRRSILHLGNLGVKVDRVKKSLVKVHDHGPVHSGEFCQFPFRWIYYCHSSKFTRKETGKMHLCAVELISFHCIVCVSKKNHVCTKYQASAFPYSTIP